jgi:hypothetical protein
MLILIDLPGVEIPIPIEVDDSRCPRPEVVIAGVDDLDPVIRLPPSVVSFCCSNEISVRSLLYRDFS